MASIKFLIVLVTLGYLSTLADVSVNAQKSPNPISGLKKRSDDSATDAGEAAATPEADAGSEKEPAEDGEEASTASPDDAADDETTTVSPDDGADDSTTTDSDAEDGSSTTSPDEETSDGSEAPERSDEVTTTTEGGDASSTTPAEGGDDASTTPESTTEGSTAESTPESAPETTPAPPPVAAAVAGVAAVPSPAPADSPAPPPVAPVPIATKNITITKRSSNASSPIAGKGPSMKSASDAAMSKRSEKMRVKIGDKASEKDLGSKLSDSGGSISF
ncbi:flocculation protein FLO11 [Galendromus occidentalis]|uniref:Flocculation protein FLO11 n=1 Tax=Galendromus occidentalis TaxID=34638 RepID=A0AAJ7L791_9ACAR|nr:flocculation protein FLO11 [Galendromus occidentalis]